MKGILHHHVEIVDAVALQDDDLSVGFIVLLLGNFILTDGLVVGFCITLLTIGNNEGYDDGFSFGVCVCVGGGGDHYIAKLVYKNPTSEEK
jgi:hypothetical protein